jgi:Holliday junction DNA helicase RuvA
MIEFIEGTLIAKTPSHVVVQVGGTGMRGIISLNTYDELPMSGEPVRLWTHLQIRDEEPVLFAFSSQEERWLFQQLITVNGVGPRLAITMLSGAKSETIRRAVTEGDSARLKSIPRIGAKIADRVVLELHKKLSTTVPDFGLEAKDGKGSGVREAVEALGALGFTRAQAEKAIEGALKRGARSVEELVKLSLRTE